ncbi:MAG: hypothetical protein ACYTAO_11640 [Planctomycetota bacterium]|jgi:hypothetical protein
MAVPAALVAGWNVLQGGLYATGLLAFIYEVFSGDPNVDLATTLKAAQKKQVQAAARRMAAREEVETEFSMARARRNQRLLSMRQGLERGSVSPVELGIRGGGFAARDMPLINQVAAQLGVDPDALAARFDPTRVGAYTPPSNRATALPPLKPVNTGE